MFDQHRGDITAGFVSLTNQFEQVPIFEGQELQLEWLGTGTLELAEAETDASGA
jgi:hypothetical protein